MIDSLYNYYKLYMEKIISQMMFKKIKFISYKAGIVCKSREEWYFRDAYTVCLLRPRMLDNEKWTLSTDTYRSSRDPRFKAHRRAYRVASRHEIQVSW